MMKTIVFVLLLSVSSIVSAEMADNNPVKTDKAVAETSSEIQMPYPVEAATVGMEGFVLISVEFDGNNVNILGINGTDEILIDYVRNFVLNNPNYFSAKSGEQVYRFDFSIL